MRRALIVGLLITASATVMPIHAAHAGPADPREGPWRRRSIRHPGWGVPLRQSSGAGNLKSTTQFSDGRTVFTDHGGSTLTNLETGATYVQHTNATFTDTSTADGNIFEVLDGRFWFGFSPGDQGPDGEVGESGAGFFLVGHFEYTFDPDTLVISSFQGNGRAINECQLLGP